MSKKWKFYLYVYWLNLFYDIKFFIFIPDNSAMPVIVLHHWCVP